MLVGQFPPTAAIRKKKQKYKYMPQKMHCIGDKSIFTDAALPIIIHSAKVKSQLNAIKSKSMRTSLEVSHHVNCMFEISTARTTAELPEV